jgi:hypothetical protein
VERRRSASGGVPPKTNSQAKPRNCDRDEEQPRSQKSEILLPGAKAKLDEDEAAERDDADRVELRLASR